MQSSRREFLNAAAGLTLVTLSGMSFAQSANTGKKLIVYFSWSGNTRYIANMIAEKTGADIIELELVKPIRATIINALTRQSVTSAPMPGRNCEPKLRTFPNMTRSSWAIPIGGPQFRCRSPLS